MKKICKIIALLLTVQLFLSSCAERAISPDSSSSEQISETKEIASVYENTVSIEEQLEKAPRLELTLSKMEKPNKGYKQLN